MTIETFANNYIPVLSGNGGSIAAGTTTINLSTGTGAPSGQSRFIVDTEIIIGSVSGTVLTATTRGAEGTTAASHLDGAQIACVLTKASLAASPGVMTTAGDLEYMTSTGPTRLAIGANTYALTSNGSVPTWAVIPTQTPLDNEAQASVLTNATSTGDAGNRSDQFTGSSLSGSWTAFGTTPTFSVAYSVLSVTAASTNGGWTRPYTPSGAFTVDFRVTGNVANGSARTMLGVYNFDGTNYVFEGAALTTQVYSGGAATGYVGASTSGTQTSLAAAIANLSFHSSQNALFDASSIWFYVRVSRDGSNNFSVQISKDRVTWATASTWNETKTITGLAIGTQGAGPFAIDFVDVVS